jgi:hypothetical protein
MILDQSWSSAAAVKNLWCDPELRACCNKEALDAELAYSKRLPEAFREEPKCATVEFLISSASAEDSAKLEGKQVFEGGPKYWRLRLDFHPGQEKQSPFHLWAGKSTLRISGSDTEHSAAYICEAAKNNGIMDIW